MKPINTAFFTRVDRVIRRNVKKFVRLQQFKRKGIEYCPPNFIFSPEKWKKDHVPVVIDVGCGYKAELSVMMIERYGAKVFAVDPTLKHRPALANLCDKYKSRFCHIPFAISTSDGTQTFFESKINESGSIMPDHVNIVNDETISYEVKVLTPLSLLAHVGIDSADMLKLDIEGAEYDLLENLSGNQLLPFGSIFIEFHHHAVSRYCEADTTRLVDKLCGFGLKAFSLDDHNYLFVR